MPTNEGRMPSKPDGRMSMAERIGAGLGLTAILMTGCQKEESPEQAATEESRQERGVADEVKKASQYNDWVNGYRVSIAASCEFHQRETDLQPAYTPKNDECFNAVKNVNNLGFALVQRKGLMDWAIRDMKTGKTTVMPNLLEMGDFIDNGEGLVTAIARDKKGFFHMKLNRDRSMEPLYENRFEQVEGHFKNGPAMVRFKNGERHYISLAGIVDWKQSYKKETTSDCSFHENRVSGEPAHDEYNECYAVVGDVNNLGFALVQKKGEKDWAIRDMKTGKMTVVPNLLEMGDFIDNEEGLVTAIARDKKGFFHMKLNRDRGMEPLYENRFEQVEGHFKNGPARATNSGEMVHYINESGQLNNLPNYDSLSMYASQRWYTSAHECSEGLCGVCYYEGHCTYVTAVGEELTFDLIQWPFWAEVGKFQEGFAEVVKRDGGITLINKRGEDLMLEKGSDGKWYRTLGNGQKVQVEVDEKTGGISETRP